MWVRLPCHRPELLLQQPSASKSNLLPFRCTSIHRHVLFQQNQDKLKMQEHFKVSSAQWPTFGGLPAFMSSAIHMKMMHD